MAVFIKVQAAVCPAVIVQKLHLNGELLVIGRADPYSIQILLAPAEDLLAVGSAVHKYHSCLCSRHFVGDFRNVPVIHCGHDQQ